MPTRYPMQWSTPARLMALTAAFAIAGIVVGLVAPSSAFACGGGEEDLGPETPQVIPAKGTRGRAEIRLNFRRAAFSLPGGAKTIAEVRVYTRNKRLIQYLSRHGMDASMSKALRQTGARHSCAAFYSGKALVSLERSLGLAIGRHYRSKTRQAGGRLDVMVVAEGEGTCTPP